jgi:dGTPase
VSYSDARSPRAFGPTCRLHIADFIAGMTDRYAIERYRQIYGAVPKGLSNV